MMNDDEQHIHFVTGRLAERAVRNIVARVAEQRKFEYSISVLPITVAALMTPKWLLRHLQVPVEATRVVLPGHLENDLASIRQNLSLTVDCGPRDIRDLPVFFGEKRARDADYGQHSIEIIAEVNHADRLTAEQLVSTAQRLIADGADRVDLGCTPGNRWASVGDAVRRLQDLSIRVSIDSFDAWEVAQACKAGAELVLSVNSTNRNAAVDWNTEVVVIPDVPGDEKSFEETIDFLAQRGIPMRLDPILEPLGCGFTSSLERYAACRKKYSEAKMLMGIGNITELTDVDSAGVNVLLLGICQELNIQSVLTTEVINWARSSVRECDLARRLVHYACQHRVPPKNLEPDLVLLRDPRVNTYLPDLLVDLAQKIKDQNIRIFAGDNQVHAVSAGVHVASEDPFTTMEQLLKSPVGNSIDREHAFYLGFEMAKALTANTLGKQYDQDQPLNWGFLTRSEKHQRLNSPRVVPQRGSNLESPEN